MNKTNKELEETKGFFLNMISKLSLEILEAIIWVLNKLFNIQMSLIEEAEENVEKLAKFISNLELIVAKKFFVELDKFK